MMFAAEEAPVPAGDFNEQDDWTGGIYDGIDWLNARHVMGRVVGYEPSCNCIDTLHKNLA